MDLSFTIKSELPVGDHQREFPVLSPENATVGSLIRRVCKENGIPMKSSYILRNSSQEELRWSSTLRDSLVMSGAVLYLCDNAEEVYHTKAVHCNIWWFLGLVSLAIGIVGLLAISILRTKDGTPIYDYGIVLDAGSSHTALYIYKWNGAKYHDTALASQIYSCRVPGPGISSYEDNPSDIPPKLRICLDQAKNTVPRDKHKKTPIFLGATAGMRLLKAVNNSKSDSILSTVRSTLQEYPFKFGDPKSQARIITGAEEGLFSWVTSNYVSGKFGVKVPPALKSSRKWQLGKVGDGTVGALDLGGASTQITFYPAVSQMPPKYTGNAELYGLNYSIYTNSYLCYGINEIDRKFKSQLVRNQNYSETIINPCGPKGNFTVSTYAEVFEAPCTKDGRLAAEENVDKNATYTFQGTSNSTQCHTAVQELFNFDGACPYSSCSFNGSYQPPVHGNFYAFSNFYIFVDLLNSTSPYAVTLQNYKESLSNMCSKSWEEVANMTKAIPEYVSLYCFRGHYILTLLTEAYKFDDNTWKNINFIDKLNGTEIGWSLGYMVDSSTNLPLDVREDYFTVFSFIMLIILFAVFVLIALGFACHALRYQKLKQRGMYEKLVNYGAV